MLGLAALVSLGLVSAGCGGGSASAQHDDPVAFSHCMRSNGVTNFPDPNSSGAIPKVGLQQLGGSSSQFQKAQGACRHLLPSSGQSSPAEVQQVMNALWKFARCLRSHGVPNWPDPLAESDAGQPGTPGFPRDMPGINQGSPQVTGAQAECQHFLAGIGYASGGYP